ncbi:MAG: acyl-CoA dehydrogenase, partial [Bacteroidota bacterium]
QKYMMTLAKEQEILMNIADMAIDIFLSESIMLRVEKLVTMKGEKSCASKLDMMRVFISDAIERLAFEGRTAINSFAEGDEQRMMLLGLKRFTKYGPINTKDARRRVAKELIDANEYCF